MKGFGNQDKKKPGKKKNNKLSKEQIINQAFKFHSQGKIIEATKYYQYFIDQGYKDHRVFSNYGIILNGIGKSQEAELSIRKAIQINPNFAEAHSNLGSILKDHGNLQEAESYTRKAIQINPNYAQAHLNLGSIFKDLGNLQEAEISTRKAIELNPNFADAHLNLGSILRDLGNLKEAEISTRKAIELNPNFPISHLNLGSILRDLGNLKEAEISTRKAIELNPNCAEAYSNLGGILNDLNKVKEAFNNYIKATQLNPKLTHINESITRYFRDLDLSQFNKSELLNILNNLMECDDISHAELFKALNFLYKNKIINNLKRFESNLFVEELFINDKLMINALRKIIFQDVELEKNLTKVRNNICARIIKNKKSNKQAELNFIIALAEQCFLNEYVYSITEEENIYIHEIISICKNEELNETNISILACYIPLYKLLKQIPSLKSFNSPNQNFKELMKLQIAEPIKEIELAKSIKKIGLINDNVSKKVKFQYEKNPYPRWRYSNRSKIKKVSIRKAINNEIKPNSISQNSGDRELNILVAGCGTGNQILQTQRYKNAKVTAIDLSLSSLSYAQRKINELGINNVQLIQMDLLEINLLDKRYDIIECGGVLHHMDDPLKGLKSLLEILKNNGFLKLGLYSELARQNIVKARNYISSKNLQANEDNIRKFRETVFSGKVSELNSIIESPDFYTISSCLDLCFHTQEHRFTIHELQEVLQSHRLEFLGFLLQQQVKSLYKKDFPEDQKHTNLQNWAKFEEKHPNIFSGMYQFWACKTKN